ncbi:MAG: hypothetical protein QXU99_04500 [Candidatus Bathyarchaeia archaeon]
MHIHRIESFTLAVSLRSLQQRLITALSEINRKPLTFEQVANPTVPQSTVIFELGIAEDENFNYLDAEEAKKVLVEIRKKPFQVLDFFCVIRYYRKKEEKETPMKFDYYLIRFTFSETVVEMRICSERGPRYVSPEDLSIFIVNEINKKFTKKVLKPTIID